MTKKFIKTLNNMGYMTTKLDKFSLEFVDFCTPSMNIFEGGAAFGIATREIIKKGSIIWVNDLSEDHLQFISDQCSESEKKRVFFSPGPIQALSFESEKFDGIFSSRMLHLLKGEDILQTLNNFFKWLKPQGKIIVIADTPFLKCYLSNLKRYESKKKEGERWPGLIESTIEFRNIAFNNIPNFINFLDLESLKESVQEAGFIVEKAEYISQDNFPEEFKLDGRESVGIIAYKP